MVTSIISGYHPAQISLLVDRPAFFLLHATLFFISGRNSNLFQIITHLLLNYSGDIFLIDFTIRHPRTGETYYWEHLGRIDDSKYFQKNCEKLQVYIQHGIIPSYNLILTYETDNLPLNADLVEKIIQYYFLNE